MNVSDLWFADLQFIAVNFNLMHVNMDPPVYGGAELFVHLQVAQPDCQGERVVLRVRATPETLRQAADALSAAADELPCAIEEMTKSLTDRQWETELLSD